MFFFAGLLFVETHTLPDETNRTQESIDESLNVLLQNESSEGMPTFFSPLLLKDDHVSITGSPLVPTDSQPGMTVPYIIIGIAISVAVVFALVGIVR